MINFNRGLNGYMKKNEGNKNLSHIDVAEDLKGNINYDLSEEREKEKIRPSLLLHSCCGPCTTSVVERLIKNYKITIFYYNPNITDKEEYIKRKEALINFIDGYNDEIDNFDKISFSEGAYERDKFYALIEGLEWEPEGGKRCVYCFKQRLEKTAETASIMGYDYFGTTLTVSPHKDFETIAQIGQKLAIRYGITFLNQNFKKQDGYKRSIDLSKKYNLYRQNYCGCEFSK